jgi:hypothetical protein
LTDSPQRPRPQFGEYASPEEQRASIKVPRESAHDESVPIARKGPVARTGPQPDQPRQAGPRPAVRATTRTPAGAGDRIATVALLVIGFLNVIATVPGMFDLAGTINSTFQQMGLGSFTPTPGATVTGIGLAIFYVVAWTATLVLSLRRLRSGRITFWVPLVAGVVVTIVAMICFLVLFLGDPSFVEYMTKNV